MISEWKEIQPQDQPLEDLWAEWTLTHHIIFDLASSPPDDLKQRYVEDVREEEDWVDAAAVSYKLPLKNRSVQDKTSTEFHWLGY